MTVRCYLVLLIASLAVSAQAQPEADTRYTLALRDVPIAEALEQFVALTEVSLVVGDEVDDAPVYCRRTAVPAEALLRCIVESVGLDFYRLSSGTYVVIERAEQAPRYGSLAGVVVDGETGEPLPGASILLADASVGTASNEAGMFTLAALAPGPYAVTASYVGYEAVIDSVWVPPDGRARCRIALRAQPFAALPVVVDGVQQRAPSTLTGVADLEGEDLRAAALGAVGPSRGARTLLGIGERGGADLHIQGGESGEHVTTLDGAPVFDPVALGRSLGAFSPLAVERLTVRKAGFGAAHGSYIAGAVELEQRLPSEPLSASVQADPYSLNAYVGGRGRRGAAMVAARTSLWGLVRPRALDDALRRWNDVDPVLAAALDPDVAGAQGLAYAPHRHGSDVAFSDLHASARFRIGPFQTVRASAYRGANEVATELFAAGAGEGGSLDRLTLARDRYHWTNLVGRVRFESLVGDRALGHVSVRMSRHTLAHGYQSVDGAEVGYTPSAGAVDTFEQALREALDERPVTDDGNRITEWVGTAGFDLSMSPRHLLEGGVEGAVLDHAFHLDNPYLRPLRSASTLGRVAAFLTDRLQVSDRVTVETGLRLTWVPDRAAAYPEPRLSVRYDAPRSPVGPVTARVAAGLYRQFVNQFDVTSVGPSALVPSVRFWLPVDASLAPPRAVHLAAEALATPADGWTVRAESYYKHLPHLLALDYGRLLGHTAAPEPDAQQAAFIDDARGWAVGAGVRIRRDARPFRWSLSYEASRTRRTFPSRFEGQTQPAPWSQPHRVQASADLRLGAGFEVRMRGRGVWGRTWGYRQAYYDFLAAHGASELVGLPADDTLPAFVEIDAGLRYTRQVGGASVAVAFDVLNVLDRANVLDYSLRSAPSGFVTVPRAGLGFRPVLSVQVGV